LTGRLKYGYIDLLIIVDRPRCRLLGTIPMSVVASACPSRPPTRARRAAVVSGCPWSVLRYPPSIDLVAGSAQMGH
jgi:hypothetical protein